ncbi:head GIN domain-containing protein [Sphingopyxis flava]|uniref:Putative auto-transporter adhesin, head GIN domain n=1 Tax=Sphingopyxis flava TaxID=1507287 RepID=A0A1T5DM48_9SPHN|nr:head GIN domain-containing protein [Sphingopyxis flava]SKB72777.1 Putative auto-transporter adhesin, head GIN domain [Sphingopyxis flava]
MRYGTRMTLLALMLATAAGCSGAERTDTGQKSDTRAESAGPAATKSFALSGFTGVEAAGPYGVTIRRGDSFAISAKGPQAELDQLEIAVEGSMLAIRRKKSSWSFRDHDDVDIMITMPRLSVVKLTGSGTVEADSVEGDAAEAAVTGSGELKIAKLSGTRVKLDMSGSGDLEVAGGKVGSGEINLTGSGDVDADGLLADTLDVSVTGSGDVKAQATGRAEVRLLGSGDVKIGGGARCSTRKTGSGTVTCG